MAVAISMSVVSREAISWLRGSLSEESPEGKREKRQSHRVGMDGSHTLAETVKESQSQRVGSHGLHTLVESLEIRSQVGEQQLFPAFKAMLLDTLG